MDQIFCFNNVWTVLYEPNHCVRDEKRQFTRENFARNIMSLLKLFYQHDVNKTDLKHAFRIGLDGNSAMEKIVAKIFEMKTW